MGDVRAFVRKWFFAAMFSVGLVLGLGLLGSGALTELGYRDATWSTGTVIGNEKKIDRDDDGSVDITWAPIIEWRDETGTKRTFTSEVSTSSAREVGSSIDIRYFPGKPASVVDSSWAGRWIKIMVGAILAPIFALFVWLTWPGRGAIWKRSARQVTQEPLTAAERAVDARGAAKGMTIAGVVFALIALGGLGVAGWAAAVEARYRDAVTVTGTVVDVERRGDTASAVIEFTDTAGEQQRFTSPISTNPAPTVGSTREVQYLPGDPGSVRDASTLGRFLPAAMGGMFALCFGMGAALFFVAARRSRREALTTGDAVRSAG